MGTEFLRLPAYAKINLSLEVLGKRDDGYHEICTIMQTVDLADELTISPANKLEVLCGDPDSSGEHNIVWDAAVALAAYSGIEPKGRIRVNKRIPTAAGLGGGSADAAAALRGLNHLWHLGLTNEQLRAIAASLGSDVPFLVEGGAASGTGRGDVLKQMTSRGGLPVLLITPAKSIARKTPTMYASLTPRDYSDGMHTHGLAGSNELAAGTITSDLCHNVFARTALEIYPGLSDLWQATAAIAEHAPCLSGAGPTFFCMPSDEQEHDKVAEVLRGSGAKVFLTRTTNAMQAV